MLKRKGFQQNAKISNFTALCIVCIVLTSFGIIKFVSNSNIQNKKIKAFIMILGNGEIRLLFLAGSL